MNQRRKIEPSEIGHRIRAGWSLAGPIIFYGLGAGLSTVAARLFLERALPLTDLCLMVGLGVIAVLFLCDRWGLSRSRAWSILWAFFGVLALVNILTRSISVYQYGDAVYLARAVAEGSTTSRWLAGNAVLSWIHSALFDWSPLSRIVPGAEVTSPYFLRVASLLAMIGSTIALHRLWPHRMAVILPTLTPIWFLFSIGYIEYYPFIAAPLVAALVWMFDRPLKARAPLQVGALCGLLCPLLYIGFAPVALLLLLFYTIARPVAGLQATAVSLVTAVAGILLLWPRGIRDFVAHLIESIPLGETATAWGAYRGQAAAADSLFFTWSYALSGEHLRHLAFMATFGAGAGLLLLALVAGAAALWKSSGRLSTVVRSRRLWLALSLVGFYLIYVVRMIPRFGPIKDIDLFFSVYIVLAVFTGLLVDKWLQHAGGDRERLEMPLLAFMIGSTAVCASLLAIHGLHQGSGGWFSQGLVH